MSKYPRKISNTRTIRSDSFSYEILGGVLLIIGWLLSLISKGGGITVGILLAAYFFTAAFQQILSNKRLDEQDVEFARGRQGHKIIPTSTATITTTPTIAEQLSLLQNKELKCPNCGSNIKPTDRKCKYCDSSLFPEKKLPNPKFLGDVELEQSVRVTHPEKGRLDLRVTNRIYYGELWQAQQKANIPWTLTGNYYAGLGLDNGMFLINWQSRFFLLDSNSPLTDNEINRDFATPARKFGASNQTADVYFIFNELSWRIDDIGRFRIELTDGPDINQEPGAVGRFIHASHEHRIIVVEDYQSGGTGQDTLWMGYKIKKSDIVL